MSMRSENTVKKRLFARSKPYVFKIDAGTGALYLEQEHMVLPRLSNEVPYMAVLILTVAVALLSYGNYIQLRTDVECRINRTQNLEQQFERMRNDNTLLERMVHQTPDLNEVYTIATTELGMIPATQDHILLFDRRNNEFVFQRDNIPNIGY